MYIPYFIIYYSISSYFIQAKAKHLPLAVFECIVIRKTERLLINTQKSVADISEILGYENPETFIRAFKKELHITPAKYRNREITLKTASVETHSI